MDTKKKHSKVILLWLKLPHLCHLLLSIILAHLWFVIKPKHYFRIASRHRKCGFIPRPFKVASRMYFNFLNALKVKYGLKKLAVEFDSAKVEFISHDGPLVFFSMHIGSFELLYQALNIPDRKSLVPVAFQNKFTHHFREDKHITFFTPDQTKLWYREAIKSTSSTMLLIDQSPAENQHKIPFFKDELAIWPELLLKLKKHNALLIPFWAEESDNVNRVVLGEPLRAIEEEKEILIELQVCLEEMVALSPYDFIWHYGKSFE